MGVNTTNAGRAVRILNRRNPPTAEPVVDRDTRGLAREALRLRTIRDAIERNGRLRVRFRGHDRLIEPHRLWEQKDGSFLIEGFQLAGGSDWGDMGSANFSRSPLGGWQGWINFPLELLEQVHHAGGPFPTRDDYNPNPVRLLGEIDRQVGARRDDGNRLFPEGIQVPR